VGFGGDFVIGFQIPVKRRAKLWKLKS